MRGPDRGPAQISIDGWVISRDKGAGVQPGFRMTDPTGQTYQIEVDPPDNPEMATGAEMIGTAFYYAFGYHTVEVYLAEFDADALVISPRKPRFAICSPANDGLLRGGISRTSCAAPRGNLTAAIARWPAASPRDGHSAISAITARVPTIPTTSCLTNTAVSCAPRGCLARG